MEKAFSNLKADEIPLCRLEYGEKAEITATDKSNLQNRLFDLGLIKGAVIEPLYKSPSGSVRAYYIKGSVIALRDSEAEKIKVSQIEHTANRQKGVF